MNNKTTAFDQRLDTPPAGRTDLRTLWQMPVSQRIAAMRRGELTLEQCSAWAARHPEQVPLLDGEFEYITIFTPEVLD